MRIVLFDLLLAVAAERARQKVSRIGHSPTHCVVPRMVIAPASTADLDGVACSDVLAETAVKGRAAQPGQVPQLTDVGSLIGRHAKREPKRIISALRSRSGCLHGLSNPSAASLPRTRIARPSGRYRAHHRYLMVPALAAHDLNHGYER
jgi:hypothetical protein